MREAFGRGLYACPVCDGWEVRDRPLAVFGPLEIAVDLALALTRWSRDVVLLTDGQPPVKSGVRDRLARHGVWQRSEQVTALERADSLVCIRFASGGVIARAAVFLAARPRQLHASPGHPQTPTASCPRVS